MQFRIITEYPDTSTPDRVRDQSAEIWNPQDDFVINVVLNLIDALYGPADQVDSIGQETFNN